MSFHAHERFLTRGRPHPGLVAVVAAPGGPGAAVAVAAARALAATSGAGPVVLLDLVLEAPHRALHGLDPDAGGVSGLLAEARFAVPGAASIDAATHPSAAGYRVLPGLRHHRDWVLADAWAAAAVLDGIESTGATVVAHVDRDLEGEDETGSLDIEDRNALARTALRRADLVLVAARDERADRIALVPTLASLAAFGVPTGRTLVVVAPDRGVHAAVTQRRRLAANVVRLSRRKGPDARLGAAIAARLAAPRTNRPAVPAGEPQRIEPGTLGASDHAVEGWITPRTPQQP